MRGASVREAPPKPPPVNWLRRIRRRRADQGRGFTGIRRRRAPETSHSRSIICNATPAGYPDSVPGVGVGLPSPAGSALAQAFQNAVAAGGNPPAMGQPVEPVHDSGPGCLQRYKGGDRAGFHSAVVMSPRCGAVSASCNAGSPDACWVGDYFWSYDRNRFGTDTTTIGYPVNNSQSLGIRLGSGLQVRRFWTDHHDATGRAEHSTRRASPISNRVPQPWRCARVPRLSDVRELPLERRPPTGLRGRFPHLGPGERHPSVDAVRRSLAPAVAAG